MNKQNYVYVYSINQIPIYVGIGNNLTGNFTRARNIGGHSEVRKRNAELIHIEIVSRNLSRKAARFIEGLLIKQYSRNFKLDNRFLGNSFLEIQPLIFTANGIVVPSSIRQKEKVVEAELRKLLKEQPEDSDSHEWTCYCLEQLSHRMSDRQLLKYEVKEAVRYMQGMREEWNEYSNPQDSNHESPLPYDDPESPADKRISVQLDYYARGCGRYYSLSQVKRLALNKSMETFCNYMGLHLDLSIHFEFEDDPKAAPLLKKLNHWFNSSKATKYLPRVTRSALPRSVVNGELRHSYTDSKENWTSFSNSYKATYETIYWFIRIEKRGLTEE